MQQQSSGVAAAAEQQQCRRRVSVEGGGERGDTRPEAERERERESEREIEAVGKDTARQAFSFFRCPRARARSVRLTTMHQTQNRGVERERERTAGGDTVYIYIYIRISRLYSFSDAAPRGYTTESQRLLAREKRGRREERGRLRFLRGGGGGGRDFFSLLRASLRVTSRAWKTTLALYG